MADPCEMSGRVRRIAGPGGLPQVELRHVSGACAAVFLHGAHVAAWRDAAGRELLFLSRCSRFCDGAPIRGGVPVIFPQFGSGGPLPQHGLARTRSWQARRAAVAPSGAVIAVFTLADDAALRTLWPHPFGLELAVTLGEDSLALALTAENPGPAPFAFQAALHTYFRVADIAQTALRGLGGVAAGAVTGPGPAPCDPLLIERETDQIVAGAPNRLVLEDRAERRQVVIENQGLRDLVIWNPWIEKARRLDDLGDEEYRTLVCVETGTIRPPVWLAPGARWTGVATLTSGARP